MKSGKAKYAMIVLGLLVLAAGIFMIKTVGDPQGVLRPLPYICIGVGCGLFGHGMSDVVSQRALRRDPALRKQMEIAQNDERNIAIANRAKSKAFDLMSIVFSALMLVFALMNVDLAALLLLVAAYLFVHGFALYSRFRLEREM